MSNRTEFSSPADLGQGTLVELFLEAVQRGDRPGFRRYEAGQWVDISYHEIEDTVRRVASALRSLGLERGDRVAILSATRTEWALADYGCLMAGIVDVPIYSSLTEEQIHYALEDSGARAIFLEDAEQLEKLEQVRADLPALEWGIVFDAPPELPEATIGWTDFLGRAEPDVDVAEMEAFREEARSARPQDIATILYTSGTTGPPKGVMLSHDNLRSNVVAASRLHEIDESDSSLSFLPLSHVFQRMVDYLYFWRGCTIAHGRSIDHVSEDLRTVRPTLVISVPRLYEKIYARVTEASGLKGRIVEWARGVGERWAQARLEGRSPGAWTALQHWLADRLVFAKIREGLGGRLRYFVSGGAALSIDINRFFLSAGIYIVEGYGLTETSPVTNSNSLLDFPENFRIGTVGKPIPGTAIRIAEDGEILVRGPQVMKGYYRRPELTEEAMTPDGWLRTGDVGEIDQDGFLRITDRKKDILVTAGGKNVAPQPIESVLRRNGFVDQLVLVGDGRKFVSLLLVPDFARLESWARENQVSWEDRHELLEDQGVQELLEGEIFRELDAFSHTEQPKKVVLLDGPFTVEDGSLTPTQKIKRRVVEDRFREIIDSLYEERHVERTMFTAF
ncbi:MAG: long-chain fatty acid--CoA ligase [Gemmatimonadota bacterium]